MALEELSSMPAWLIWTIIMLFVMFAIAVGLIASGVNIGTFTRGLLSLILKS